MERQIKFRGKRADNGEWVYGYFVEDGFYTIWAHNEDDFLTQHLVDPDTVGQFTGLTDCNSKEIYEGDILGVSGRIIGYVIGGVRGYCYDVVFINHSAGEKTWPLYSTVKYDYPYEITVIGNIHDNSSLIHNQPTAI